MIEQQLDSLYQHIHQVSEHNGRSAEEITLVAVSKNHPVSAIRRAYAKGQRHFGENYLNEALDKQRQLSKLEIIWHYIGRIQSNKTRKMAEQFDWIHTVESLRIATRLSNQRPQDLPELNVCLQINIDEEDSKSGLPPDKEQLLSLAQEIHQLPQLCLRGLMCIPALKASVSEEIKTFSKMQALQNHLKVHGIPVDTLSMGMTNDLDSAIRCGSTLLRVGTAIFGSRE